MIRWGAALAAAVALAACAAPPPPGPAAPGPAVTGPATGSTASTSVRLPAPPRLAIVPPPAAEADAFAVAFLDTIQARSFAGRREYCGYFLVVSGRIVATDPIPGTTASCTQPAPPPNAFASYHTHGAFDRDYDNEVPSPEDMLGDFAFGIDGYISTPGGRVWRVEVDERAALQICGLGCVAVDRGFIPRNETSIPPRMTVQDVLARY